MKSLHVRFQALGTVAWSTVKPAPRNEAQMKRLAAATAIFAALGIGASTATAGAVPFDRGPAGHICTAHGGEFLPPPDESSNYYACVVDFATLGPNRFRVAMNVCENVYGGIFRTQRTLYWCQQDIV
jgi:hypothetical protein